MRSSVGISGIGAVSSAGGDVRRTLEAFREGRGHHTTAPDFETSIACPAFAVTAILPVLCGRYNHSRSLRLAMLAVGEAMADAGLDVLAAPTRVGVCIGTTVASQLNSIPFYDAYRRHTAPDLGPVYDYLGANLARAVGDLLGATGPKMTVVNACSSGTDAIGIAASWIRAGLCDVAIAGGADELSRVPLAGFWSLGVMSTRPCAPFDRDRDGLNLGEGAGIVVLESGHHARSRGKKHAFEVAGFGTACDAHHLTAPHPQGRGLRAAITIALNQAEITSAQIAFVNAHGTATLDNDRAEGTVIATSYDVQRSTTSGGPYTTIATGVSATSYLDTTATNGTIYYYVVSAVDLAGEGANSAEVSAEPPGPGPATPTDLTPTPGNAQVSLTWGAAAGATTYNIQRSTISGGPYTTIATGVAGTSYPDTTVTNGTTYYYVVSGVDVAGEGADSTEVSALPLAPPAAPTGLTCTSANAQVALTWTAAVNATSYDVKRSTTSGGPYTTIATNVTAASYLDAAVTDGIGYFYAVSGIGVGGEGANSARVRAEPEPASHLVFAQQPGNATAGMALSPAVVVNVVTKFGRIVSNDSSNVTLVVHSGPGAATGTLTVAAVNGVATFGDVVLDTAGNYTLKATDAALAAATSKSFTVSPAAASQLVFGKQPSNVTAGKADSPAITVKVADQFGNVVTTNTSSVTLAVNSGPGAAAGTLIVAAVKGVATFSKVTLDTAGACTLTATDGVLTSARSDSFTVNPAAAHQLIFVQQPSATTPGVAISPAITVNVEDEFGNIVTTDNSDVTLAVDTGPGVLSGTLTVAADDGVAM